AELLDALLRKARAEVDEVLTRAGISAKFARLFRALLKFHGSAVGVRAVTEEFRAAPPTVRDAIRSFAELIAIVRARVPNLDVQIDLAELRGYHYHTGVMFAAYTPRLGRALAWGGRYDNLGMHFGRARPATGFSTDLKLLAAMNDDAALPTDTVFAPALTDAELDAAIGALRKAGTVVIQALPGQRSDAKALGCARQLVRRAGAWRAETLKAPKVKSSGKFKDSF
ncbi:MAG: ATP phosphoribosyltransferase regulatory subunit, partial [Gammaproteobacteria bacterium]